MDGLTLTAITGFSGAAFTLCLVWAVGQALDWPAARWKRAAPVLALVFGIAWNWIAFMALQPENASPWRIVLLGLFSGFAASGAWSQIKNAVVEPMRAEKLKADLTKFRRPS